MSDRLTAERVAAAWIARRDAGPWTQADRSALDDWLEESASHRAAYFRLNSAWQDAGRLSALLGSPATDDANASRKRCQSRWYAIAASVLLVVGLAFVAWRYDLLGRNTYSTVVGGLQAIPLADGSQVILNTDSEVNLAWSENERRVELRHGEAFFEVAKDPNRPFVVAVGKNRVVAVGTAFSVRREGEDLRVAVVEGKIRVDVPGKSGIMEPVVASSIVRTVDNEVLVQTRPQAEIDRSLSWRSGLLTFRDTPLADAVAEFNRYNVRKILIEDPQIATLEVGGIFRVNNVEAFVQLLQAAFAIQVRVDDNRIVLTSR
jgi:transmembrane sensor